MSNVTKSEPEDKKVKVRLRMRKTTLGVIAMIALSILIGGCAPRKIAHYKPFPNVSELGGKILTLQLGLRDTRAVIAPPGGRAYINMLITVDRNPYNSKMRVEWLSDSSEGGASEITLHGTDSQINFNEHDLFGNIGLYLAPGEYTFRVTITRSDNTTSTVTKKISVLTAVEG